MKSNSSIVSIWQTWPNWPNWLNCLDMAGLAGLADLAGLAGVGQIGEGKAVISNATKKEREGTTDHMGVNRKLRLRS